MLAGCVGFGVTKADYEETFLTATNRQEVRAEFGDPLRTGTEEGLEVWYYKSDEAPSSSTTAVALVILPISSTEEYADNLKVFFRGDDVVKAAVRTRRARGGYCGLIPGTPGCALLE